MLCSVDWLAGRVFAHVWHQAQGGRARHRQFAAGRARSGAGGNSGECHCLTMCAPPPFLSSTLSPSHTVTSLPPFTAPCFPPFTFHATTLEGECCLPSYSLTAQCSLFRTPLFS